VVGSYIEQRIYFGFIKDRTDVLDAVSELGEVTRISDKFISLKLDGADKAIRLKGAFYESEFSIESYFENRTRETNDARASREYRFIPEEHRKLAEQLEKDLQSLQEDVQNTTENAINLLNEAKLSLISVQTESQNLAQFYSSKRRNSQLLNQQAEQLEQLKAQSAQLNSMSQGIAETAKIKKTLLHQI
jgi:methyl-accepting chemotaxis protein